MKTVIVGAGAIGSLLACYMTKGGADITLLDLPEVADRINERPVRIKIPSGETFQVKLKATSSPESLNDMDLIIFCVKTLHTESAVRSVAHLKDSVKAVLSIQNGVDKELILEKYFGKGKIIGGCCLEAASRVEDDTIMHTMSVITYLGELDGTISPRVESAAGLFTQGGLKAEAKEHVVSADWCKWTNFAAGAGVCGLTRLPYYLALLNPNSANLIAQIYREYAELASVKGIEVRDYPGFEVKTISRASTDEAVRLLQKRGEALEKAGAKSAMPSLAQDIIAGRKTECDSIFGFAIQEGENANLPMTFTRYVYALIKAIDQKQV